MLDTVYSLDLMWMLTIMTITQSQTLDFTIEVMYEYLVSFYLFADIIQNAFFLYSYRMLLNRCIYLYN